MTSQKKVRRNDPCPCGSGLKYKRCCLARDKAAPRYTPQDRFSAFSALERFTNRFLTQEDDAAFEAFWECQPDDEEELDEYVNQVSSDIFDMWFWFDRPLEDGRLVVDRLLREEEATTKGERCFLEAIRESCMKLYEVIEVRPGLSVTLQDYIDKTQVTVTEKMGSRQLKRSDLLAARVVNPGYSGEPEIDGPPLPISFFIKNHLVSQLLEYRTDFLRDDPLANDKAFFKQMPPFFHAAWLSSILNPPIPRLQNADGESILFTRVHFEVREAERLIVVLDDVEVLEREKGASEWQWYGKNHEGEVVSLGRLEMKDRTLLLETNSAERAERGRAMIEAAVGDAVCHRMTSHEDPTLSLRQAIRSGELQNESQHSASDEKDIPFEVQEDVVLDFYARHYRQWIDDKIPMLDDLTPRQAAADPARRAKVAELIRGLEGLYERSLAMNKPAYDPSWMWSELGFVDRIQPKHPPILAHERWSKTIPGWMDLCRSVSSHLRTRPDFDDAYSTYCWTHLETDLDVQRFIKARKEHLRLENDSKEQHSNRLAHELHFAINYELHRRKTFWVDESLAFMLAQTELEASGEHIRVPFPCFALVFTDRHLLSLAERLLAAHPSCPLAGYLLRVATVYMIEEHREQDRVLHLGLALDSLGADPPFLFEHQIELENGARIRLDQHPDLTQPLLIEGNRSLPARRPLTELLRVILNAVLYATSAGVEPELRSAPRKRTSEGIDTRHTLSSEQVYFLPGKIEISKVRRLQELARIPGGRKLVNRFMVRGHWRRPAKSWKEQRMRWIEPYWKGPNLAAVIEKTYKMTK